VAENQVLPYSVLQVVAALVEKTGIADYEKATQCLCEQPVGIDEKVLKHRAVIAVLQVKELQAGTAERSVNKIANLCFSLAGAEGLY